MQDSSAAQKATKCGKGFIKTSTKHLAFFNNTLLFFYTVCHAAVNAIASRTIPDLTDCTMYITLHPDEDCAHAIAKSGIKEVKCMTRRKTNNEERARAILLLHGRVLLKYVDIIITNAIRVSSTDY